MFTVNVSACATNAIVSGSAANARTRKGLGVGLATNEFRFSS